MPNWIIVEREMEDATGKWSFYSLPDVSEIT